MTLHNVNDVNVTVMLIEVLTVLAATSSTPVHFKPMYPTEFSIDFRQIPQFLRELDIEAAGKVLKHSLIYCHRYWQNHYVLDFFAHRVCVHKFM